MADVFVNPTYQDNFPTTNIEALACGTPVVTYRTGGSPEAVDAETGIVVDKGDLAGMGKAIQEVMSSGSLTRERCRKRAEIHFDQHKQFSRYAEIFEKTTS
jgi:glycosyltransferase involved in cell wall biosynthesis